MAYEDIHPRFLSGDFTGQVFFVKPFKSGEQNLRTPKRPCDAEEILTDIILHIVWLIYVIRCRLGIPGIAIKSDSQPSSQL